MNADLPIYFVRGMRVVLSHDIAPLFETTTGRLNERIRNNTARFEGGYGFKLSEQEWESLRSQNTISNNSRGGIRYAPWAFSEHGVVMAATLLRTPKAIEASRRIVETFVVARREEARRKAGKNLPAHVPVQDLVPLEQADRNGLLAKLDAALGRVLDAIADPVAETTVRDEARSIALEGLNAIKAHLKKQDIANEKTLAEVQKLLREAEEIDANIAAKQIENNHRHLAYQAKQLRIVIEIQRYLERGDVDSLLNVLKDLGN